MLESIPKNLSDTLNNHPIFAIDVGSRDGVSRFGSLEPYINIIGFEADANEAAKLQEDIQRVKRFHSCSIEPFAVWSSNIESKLYICNYLPNCSLLKPNVDCAKKFGLEEQFTVVSTRAVPCKALETLLQDRGLPSPDYLKIDAQGGDLEVLKGLNSFIKDVLLIRLEVIFVPLYHGNPTFGEIDQFMNANNFRLLSVQNKYPRSIRSRDTIKQPGTDQGEFVWADLIYAQDFEFFFPLKTFNKEKALIYALLLAYEGFNSLAIDFLISISKKQNFSGSFVQSIISTIIKNSHKKKIKRQIVTFIPKKVKNFLKTFISS